MIEAVRWWGPFITQVTKQGPTVDELHEWGCMVEPDGHWGGACGEVGHENYAAVLVPTLEGSLLAREGDYIVRGTQGEFYPVKPSIFMDIYEEVK